MNEPKVAGISRSAGRVARQPQALGVDLRARTVAVIGATEKSGSVGRTVFWNLVKYPFGGTVLPVNPHRSNVLGIKAYPSVKAFPSRSTSLCCHPGGDCARLIGECVDAGSQRRDRYFGRFQGNRRRKGRTREPGAGQARRGRMRLIGPNCLGVMRPYYRAERHVCRRDGSTGNRRLYQPERRACARRFSTGACKQCRLQRASSPSARCSTSTGAT